MSNTCTIPDNVKKYRPEKCTRIRNDNGIYRVYKYSAIKLPNGKWSSSSGYLIGKIIPDRGFSPNKRYLREQARPEGNSTANIEEITDLAYGQYALLILLSGDVYTRLKKCFPLEKATQIYAYGLILCANGFLHVDQINEIYQESYLSLLYKDYDFKMGPTALGKLLHDLGAKGNPVRAFEQSLIDDCSRNIAIDGHVIRSCSEENDLAEAGYKTKLLKSSQVNILIAYDTKRHVPLMYRAYRGSSVDKKSCESFLRSRSFTNTRFVVDRGFFSSVLLDLMSSNGNSYIIPVPTSDKNFKRIKAKLQYTSGEFVYKGNTKDSARILYYEEQIDDNTRMIFYKDYDENNSKRKSYRQSIDEGETGYTQENYDKYSDWWGVYVLQCSCQDPAPQIFTEYKDRWSIETYNNYIKNDADYNDLKLQDYYNFQGFNFIMLVAGIIHSNLQDATKALEKPNISTIDILLKSGHMRLVRQDSEWVLHNTRTKDLALFKEMGFVPDMSYKASK